LSFGKAISYTLDNWKQLVTYVEYPDLTPSNNAAERAIRPFVIGRKNWLFSRSPKGAKGSAILYSLVESAKLHDLSAFEYMNYIFRKIPYCRTSEDWAALLPFNISSEQLKVER
jgi:transposase